MTLVPLAAVVLLLLLLLLLLVPLLVLPPTPAFAGSPTREAAGLVMPPIMLAPDAAGPLHVLPVVLPVLLALIKLPGPTRVGGARWRSK